MERKNVFKVIILSFLIFTVAFAARAGEPTEKMRETTDKILSIVSDPNLKDPGKAGERKKLIWEAVDERFDWNGMSQRALARHWKKRSKEERLEFIALFGKLLERTYLDKVEGYSGEKVSYEEESVDGAYAVVKVRIVTSKNEEINVDYRLSKKENDWLVYDISVEGVSLIQNYRVQFNSIITRSSFNVLMKRLKGKVAGK